MYTGKCLRNEGMRCIVMMLQVWYWMLLDSCVL